MQKAIVLLIAPLGLISCSPSTILSDGDKDYHPATALAVSQPEGEWYHTMESGISINNWSSTFADSRGRPEGDFTLGAGYSANYDNRLFINSFLGWSALSEPFERGFAFESTVGYEVFQWKPYRKRALAFPVSIPTIFGKIPDGLKSPDVEITSGFGPRLGIVSRFGNSFNQEILDYIRASSIPVSSARYNDLIIGFQYIENYGVKARDVTDGQTYSYFGMWKASADIAYGVSGIYHFNSPVDREAFQYAGSTSLGIHARLTGEVMLVNSFEPKDEVYGPRGWGATMLIGVLYRDFTQTINYQGRVAGIFELKATYTF